MSELLLGGSMPNGRTALILNVGHLFPFSILTVIWNFVKFAGLRAVFIPLYWGKIQETIEEYKRGKLNDAAFYLALCSIFWQNPADFGNPGDFWAAWNSGVRIDPKRVQDLSEAAAKANIDLYLATYTNSQNFEVFWPTLEKLNFPRDHLALSFEIKASRQPPYPPHLEVQTLLERLNENPAYGCIVLVQTPALAGSRAFIPFLEQFKHLSLSLYTLPPQQTDDELIAAVAARNRPPHQTPVSSSPAETPAAPSVGWQRLLERQPAAPHTQEDRPQQNPPCVIS